MGNRIYGCDDCLAVCPWNKFAQTATEMRYAARPELISPRLEDLAQLDDAGFRALFAGSPIKRIGRDRFVRNVLYAIGNSGDKGLAGVAQGLVNDPDAAVRGCGALGGGETAMKLLIFGYGYSARFLVRELAQPAGTIRVTTRSADKAARPEAAGLTARIFPGTDMAADLAWATHVLSSAGPEDGSDPVLAEARKAFADAANTLVWVGYLSTTGVYGDHQGGWVDETTPLTPSTERGQARVAAETEWMDLHRKHGLPVHIFRLAGIYGPGRGPFEKVRDGTARRIIKPGQVFSRIHAEDIAQVLLASMARPDPGAVYNVCDDDPAPPQDVIGHAATLLGLPQPPDIAFETAELSPMAASFYAESKRVDNRKIKEDLGVPLRYPDYRAGLAAVLVAETAKT